MPLQPSSAPASWLPGLGGHHAIVLDPGRTSETLLRNAVLLGRADDATAVTAAQVLEVMTRRIDAGHWRDGDPLARPAGVRSVGAHGRRSTRH